MKQQILNFLKGFLPFSLALLAVHYFVNYFLQVELFYPLWGIYLFLVLASFLIYLTLIFINQNFSEKTGFAFMGLSLLKMLAAVIFLLPLMLSGTASMLTNIMSFFVPYFLFLIYETISAVKIINSN